MHRSLPLTLQKENCIVPSIFVDFFFFLRLLPSLFSSSFCLLICLAELLFLSDVVVTWAGGRIKRMAVMRPGISLLMGRVWYLRGWFRSWESVCFCCVRSFFPGIFRGFLFFVAMLVCFIYKLQCLRNIFKRLVLGLR